MSAVGALAAGGIGTGFFFLVKEGNAEDRIATKRGHQVEQMVKNDGFTAEVGRVYDGNTGSTEGVLKLGNCMIQNVEFTFEGNDKSVTDVTKYSFDAKVYPHQETRRVNRHSENYVDGNIVTFEFKNLEDLEKHVLGGQPCAALAQNLAIQNQIG